MRCAHKREYREECSLYQPEQSCKGIKNVFSWIRVYGHLKRKGFPSSRSEFQFSSQQADVVVTKEVIMMQIERFLSSKLSFHRHRRRPFHKWKCFVESSTSRGSLGECSSRGQVLDIVWKRAETLKLGINILDGDERRFRREAHWGNYGGNIFFISAYIRTTQQFFTRQKENRAPPVKNINFIWISARPALARCLF